MVSLFGRGFDSRQLHFEPHSNECGFVFYLPDSQNFNNINLISLSGKNNYLLVRLILPVSSFNSEFFLRFLIFSETNIKTITSGTVIKARSPISALIINVLLFSILYYTDILLLNIFCFKKRFPGKLFLQLHFRRNQV